MVLCSLYHKIQGVVTHVTTEKLQEALKNGKAELRLAQNDGGAFSAGISVEREQERKVLRLLVEREEVNIKYRLGFSPV